MIIMDDKKKNLLKSSLGVIALLVVLLLLPLIQTSMMPFIMNLLIMSFIYICLAESWNILAGFCRLLSMGHCAFFGLGAYITVMVIIYFDMTLLLAILISVLFNSILAYIIGAISIRVKDIFFAMVTLAVAQLLFSLSMQWVDVTRGPRGLIMPPLYNLDRRYLYYIALAMVVIYVAIVLLIRRSRLGTMLLSLRDNEILAKSLGVNTSKWKIVATIISAVMASLVGSFYILYIRSVQPGSVFTFDVTMKIMIVAFIGGRGTAKGPILGAIIIIIDELIRGWLGGTYAGLPGIIYGLILALFVVFMPNGLISIFNLKDKSTSRSAPKKEVI